jgi:hypothetical protein
MAIASALRSKQRRGDRFAQRQLGCRAEAGQQIVVDGNLLRVAVERVRGFHRTD